MSLFFKERWEQFTHGCSFVNSDKSELLTVPLYNKWFWAKERMSKRANEQKSEWPQILMFHVKTLLIFFYILHFEESYSACIWIWLISATGTSLTLYLHSKRSGLHEVKANYIQWVWKGIKCAQNVPHCGRTFWRIQYILFSVYSMYIYRLMAGGEYSIGAKFL